MAAGSKARRWVIYLAIAGALFAMQRCTQTYAHVLRIHLDVLTSTATKLCAVIAMPGGFGDSGMAEYRYPAQRARQFLAEQSEYREHPSYAKLGRFLDSYEALVRDVDAARTEGENWRRRLPDLEERRAALFALNDEIRADLEREWPTR